MIGDIIFIKSPTLKSWLIRKITKSEYSHVVVSVTESNDWIIEADSFKKVNIVKNKYKDGKIVNLQLSDSEKVKLISYLIEQKSKPYDYLQIIGFFFRLTGLYKKDDLWNSVNRIICSELIDKSYGIISKDLVPDKLNGDVTPEDLARVLLGE